MYPATFRPGRLRLLLFFSAISAHSLTAQAVAQSVPPKFETIMTLVSLGAVAVVFIAALVAILRANKLLCRFF